MPISPDQASQLLSSGQISQDTYDSIVGSQPTAVAPVVPPVQTMPSQPVTQAAPVPEAVPAAPEPAAPSMLDKIIQAAPEAAQKTVGAIKDTIGNAINPPVSIANATPMSPTGSAPGEKIAPSALISNQTQTAPNPNAAATQALKDIENDTLQAQTHQEAANIALAKAGENQAKAEYNAKVQGDKVLNDLQQQHVEKEKNQQAIIDNKVLDMEQASKDYNNLPPLDQNRYWSKASTGDKLLAGISVILGGISQGKGETKTNPGIDYVNNAIDKDLESQKEMIGRKKEAFAMQDSLLGRMYTRYGNWEQAELAAKNAALEGVQRKLDIATSQYSSPLIQAKANLANKEIENQKQVNKLKFQLLAQTNLNSPLAVGTGAEIPNDPSILARLPKEASDSKVRLPNGNYGIATTPKAAEDLRAYLDETSTISDGIEKLRQYANLGSRFSPEDRAKAEAERLSLMQVMDKALINQRITRETKDVFDKLLKNPVAMFGLPSQTKASYDALQNAMANETQNKMFNAGVSKRKVNFSPSK